MENENQVAEQQEEKVPELDVASILEENAKLKKDLKIVSEHKDKLYNETKKAKEERDRVSQEAKRSDEEKAKKDGEFERLYQTKSQEIENLKKEFETHRKQVRGDKIQVAAMRVANELADGDNAELLSDFVVRKLDSLADETGSLSDDVMSDIRQEFSNNQKYKSLLRGSKASGGNAIGNPSGKAHSNIISRADFEKMNQAQRGQFFKSGGSLKD